MFLVGLTGGIATGKSTVSSMFEKLGCEIVDADKIARQVVEPGTRGLRKIKHHFGEGVLTPDGTLDRGKLGSIIFAREEKRKLLNSITHPEIMKAMFWQVLGHFIRGKRYVIMDIPLLFEGGKMTGFMTYTVVVACDKETEIERLRERNNLTQEEAEQRINTQMSLADKCQRATYVIDNNSSLEQTRFQVLDIFNKFESSWAHWKLRLFLGGILLAMFGLFSWCVIW